MHLLGARVEVRERPGEAARDHAADAGGCSWSTGSVRRSSVRLPCARVLPEAGVSGVGMRQLPSPPCQLHALAGWARAHVARVAARRLWGALSRCWGRTETTQPARQPRQGGNVPRLRCAAIIRSSDRRVACSIFV
jgi:hypothetical protein